MIAKTYDEIRDQLRTFDVVLWWGQAPLSLVIRKLTGGPSHIAMVLRDDANDVISLWEATTKEDKSGVMISLMSASVEEYEGRIVWRPATIPNDLRIYGEAQLPSIRRE